MELPLHFRNPRAMKNALVMKGRPKSLLITCTNMSKKTNFYKVLALDSEDADINKIKRAYRAMALRLHPDVCPPSKREEFTTMFVEICTAYETLIDPIMRKIHDRQLGFDGEEMMEVSTKEEAAGFNKEVWMKQINELQARSSKRMHDKNK